MASTSAEGTDDIRKKIEEHKEQIEELRRTFFQDCDQDDPESPFDPRDLEWIRTTDAYMYHVLLIGRMDLTVANEKLHKILKWRKEYGVNDMTFESFPEHLREMGGLYAHGVDKKGQRILWFKVKTYQKTPENLLWAKKMTVYWLNRLQKEDPASRIAVLEDMTGAGVSNMDIELIRFKITCFELYFPALVDMLYIYDMPWILNTLWKVVERILSQQAREHIKFIRGKEVLTHINQDNLPLHMGGTDTYEWEYIPEEEEEEEEDHFQEAEGDVGAERSLNESFRSMDGDSDRSLLPIVNAARSLRQPKQNKKVHFQDEVDGKENVDPEHSSIQRRNRKQGGHSKRSKAKAIHIGPLVTIKPGDSLVFEPPSSIAGAEGVSASLTITNTTDKKVVYKVKTTTPERYKVRPSMGPINPGASIHITITLLTGPGESVLRDKFLILSSESGDGAFRTTTEITHFWKNVRPEDLVEHRMGCVFTPTKARKGEVTEPGDGQMQTILNKLKSMDNQMGELRRQNSRLIWLQGLLLLTTIFLVLYLFYFRPEEGVLLSHSVTAHSAAPSPCGEATEKLLRGVREGL